MIGIGDQEMSGTPKIFQMIQVMLDIGIGSIRTFPFSRTQRIP